MISENRANIILQDLVGYFSGQKQKTNTTVVYMGLSANEPLKDGRVSYENGVFEPAEKTSDGATTGYARRAISEPKLYETRDKIEYYVYNGYFGAASNGIIKNNKEFQMPTARKPWAVKRKLKYWFLSNDSTIGSPVFLWGEIKSPILEGKEEGKIDSFTAGESGQYTFERVLDFTLKINSQEEYVVKWDLQNKSDAKEFTVKPTLEGKKYVFNIASDDATISITFESIYENEELKTKMIVNSSINYDSPVKLTIYEKGIYVPRNTVPTFYEETLQASIDREIPIDSDGEEVKNFTPPEDFEDELV